MNLVNRGSFPSAGGSSIVNATGWNTAKDYTVVSLPSMRMIVDLANWDNSVAIQTTGQSGHAFHRHLMLWQQEKVASSATKSLMLMP
ncbi:hypothetical protein CEN49_12440 [Fischerella thermalis CCMEE 5273]|nr:hypothetical protein CBP18_15620 [Fischerella thermalis WC119]PLZ09229.1 hypothetical protein CBP19_16005 [Fischerella thermalis WC1110]PLZ13449.1 hypothetical protein CBP17_05680 [Fischerella thermalis WC114]PLZ19871.1 hypothetical protein CBP30_12705 [Fischerella thermalis WC157]PLZ20827.1 hypothetical protein CBP29_16610 [Fischerella thermalis WC341]PLZ32343.1 hypothetical protein CBP28_05185 [Fischerella thermalis WC559]PLZ34121.1 hypothetical protein CBP10_06645 [Fischerella thermalis